MISANYIQSISISVYNMVKNIYEDRLLDYYLRNCEDEREVNQRVQSKINDFCLGISEFENLFQEILTLELCSNGEASFDSKQELEYNDEDCFSLDIRNCFNLCFGCDLDKLIGVENCLRFHGNVNKFQIEAKTFLKDHYEILDSETIENVYDKEPNL